MKTDSKPWHKQFWPWFLIAIPLSSVIMGVIMIKLALEGEDSLVRQDWYKDGMAINQRLDKQLKARELGITARFTLKQDQSDLLVDVENINTSAEPELILDLMHPTLKSKDHSIRLYLAPNEQYYAKLDTLPKGVFYVLLRPPVTPWELEGKIDFSGTVEELALTPHS